MQFFEVVYKYKLLGSYCNEIVSCEIAFVHSFVVTQNLSDIFKMCIFKSGRMKGI